MTLQAQIDQLQAAKGLPNWAYESLEAIRIQAQETLQQVQADALEKARHHAQQLQSKEQELKNKEVLIAKLEFENKYLKRLKFGASNEALPLAIRDLFAETLDADLAAINQEAAQRQDQDPSTPSDVVTYTRKQRTIAGRQPLPAHLPRILHHHEPGSCTCGECGTDLVRIGEDITEQLDVKPAEFFVHRHIRGKYACRTCQTLETAPVPAQIIEGGMACPGLLTWLTVSKYADHLPLYRLEEIASRQQVPLARSTLAAWTGEVGVALQPLADALQSLLLQRGVLHADETPVRQLDPGRGKTKKAFLWAYRSNDLDTGPPIILFDYQTSRAGVHARTFLQDWQGHLLTDDYAGYKQMYACLDLKAPAMIELGCWAHARRKFFDLHVANQSALAAKAMAYIAKLYQFESEAKPFSEKERKAYRQRHALPQLQILKEWLLQERIKLAPGSATTKAVDYTLGRWDALERYANSGNLPIDNNPVENCIRPIAIGKKNWLFTGSERAGKRAAAIQSLIGTARLNDLDPYAWMQDTLEKLPTWPNSRIFELLPLKQNKDLAV
jgi:transposase